MSQFPEPAEQLKDTPLRFLETEQFQEMLDTYNKLKAARYLSVSSGCR